MARCYLGFLFFAEVWYSSPSTTLSFIFPNYFLLFLLRDGTSKEAAVTSHVFSFPELGSQ